MTVFGAILAAGASTRLAPRRKQLIEVDGEPLVRRAARLMLGSRCARVAVVLGAFADEIAPALAGTGVVILDNPSWPEGMGSSVRVAADWAAREVASALLVAVCDQRALSTAHFDALIAASSEGEGDGDIVGSAYADTVGVPAIFPHAAYVSLFGLRGDRGARGLLAGRRAIALPEGEVDIDTPSDL